MESIFFDGPLSDPSEKHMEREYIYWQSTWLARKMEMLIFGYGGRPVLVFPTSMGRFYQYEDFGMVGALASLLESGAIQLFCVDSVDEESWYNKQIEPGDRCYRHSQYENYILHELLPFLRQRNPNCELLMLTGCSFGAYHSVNMAFRHPELVRRVVAMGGKYEIRHLMGGYYDESVYFNSPIDFLPGLNDNRYLQYLHNSMEIVLLTGENDICRESTVELSRILVNKQIPHILDIWGEGAGHDWPWWRQMILKYI